MRTYIITAGFLACLVIFADGHHPNKQVSGLAEAATSAAVTAVRKSETVTTQTETVVEETIEETVETTTWQQYFVTSFSSWKSLDLKSTELKDKVSVCFSETVNGFTYWEKISKNLQYVEFLAAATGYSGKTGDVSKIKEHCVKIAASKPRLLALAFKSISKHMKNSNEKLVVSKLAKKKYNIGEKVIEVKKDWKQFAISNFLNFKSDEGNSKELIKKVTTVLEYDSTYFDKFLKKKIYAEYLAHATGYTGDIKKCEELKKYLKTTAKSKPRLVALALKYLSKNLKNSKVELTISPTAIKRFGIKQKTCKKVDWKSHLIKEYLEYKSTEKYKEADQRLRVSSMLKYEADGGTILDLILKRKQYKEFFAKSIGYSYSESSFDEKDFREYVKTTSELYPTLVSLSFRSICKNLKSNEKLVIAPSAEKIIKEKLTKKETTETKKSKKITKTTTTTTTTKTWEEYVINEFSSFKSMSEESSEVKEKVKNFLGYSSNGYSCLEKILKRESYAEYLAYSTGYKGDYKETEKLIKHLESVGKSKPRLLACSLKYVTKNIENSSEKLVVSKVAQEKYKIENKVFDAKLDWKKFAIKEFANWRSESSDSSELKTRVSTILKYDETYWNKILSNTKYFEYLRISTGYKGSSTDVNAFKTHFQKICNEKPRLAALSIKKLAKHFQNSKEKLTVSRLAKTKYNIQETEIVKTDWTSYAVKNFANFESEKDKSHLIKARLKKLIDLDADGTTYLDKVLKRTVYAEYISRATGFTIAAIVLNISPPLKYSCSFKGDWRKPERLRDYLRTIIESRPRLVACAFKYIAKNHQDSKSKLEISEVAKSRFNIGKNKWAGYAIANFADLKTNEDKSHLIRTRIQKLVGLEAEGSTYLDKILQVTSYAEYFAKSTGYTGDCKDTQAFKQYITQVIKDKPRLVACSLKYIAKNQADTKAALKISNVAKNRFKIGQTTTTSTATETSTVTKSSQSTGEVSTSSTSCTTYLTKYFKDVTETSRKSEELVNIIENFRVAENGDILTEVLKNTEYINYLKSVTRYSGQDNISEFRNFLQNEFFRKRPRFIALAFKQILLYSEGSSSLVAPTYCDNYWKQEETKSVTSSSQSESSSSSQTVTKQSSSSSSSVSTSTSSYLKNFMNLQSASSEKTKITEIISEFARGSYLDEILKDSTYAKYLAATLEYTDDYTKDAFRVYIKKTILKDRPLALALSLKKIYYHICNEQELVIPTYVSTKYQITESDYAVSSSSSSSSYTSYSSSSSSETVQSETVVEVDEE